MRPLWFGLAAILTLAACEGELSELFDPATAAGGGVAKTSKAVGKTSVTVTQKNVTLRAAEGFCVDPVSTRSAASEAFVVFGNCASITRNPDQPQPFVQAVVTATVTSSGLAGEGAIAPNTRNLLSFFRTSAGRAALSRSSDATTVAIIDGILEDGSVFVEVRDTSAPSFTDAQERYWRGYFDNGGSVIAVSVIGFRDNPISGSEGLTVLRGFAERNRSVPRIPTLGVAAGGT